MIASAGTWVGPWEGDKTSFTNWDPEVLGAPAAGLPGGPIPRTIPQDVPTIPDGNKIIIYIPGGGSRAEEAVDMASWFIIEGSKAGEEYTVISFDLPNSAYGAKSDGSRFDVTDVTGKPYDYSQGDVFQFELDYIMAFIEKLDEEIGNVTGRVAAVMGGSLGGNTSLSLTRYYDAQNRPYLRTIVSWSVTAMAPDKYVQIISGGAVAAFLSQMQSDATKPEPYNDHAIEAQYLQDLYVKPLSPVQLVIPLPPQPVMWFRGGYKDSTGNVTGNWQPCKDQEIARSRFDRYEIYSPYERHWITAVDLEQISFSFQDDQNLPKPTLGTNLMLVAGDNDNYFPNEIYNSTIDVARAIRQQASGKAEFWLDTGHSIHNERPHLFVKEILYFLANPHAGDSPYGTVVSTPPNAVYSVTDQ
jgi:pimeloyl-ACP methyl ester carboxylesterase